MKNADEDFPTINVGSFSIVKNNTALMNHHQGQFWISLSFPFKDNNSFTKILYLLSDGTLNRFATKGGKELGWYTSTEDCYRAIELFFEKNK